MCKTIKANLINGNLVPLEPCVLNDGDEILVHVVNGAASKPSIEEPVVVDKPVEMDAQSSGDDASRPKGHPILAKIEAIKANLRDYEQPDELPPDAAKNYKHYLYGGPKESD